MAFLATVVHAMFTSRFDYCNAAYVGAPLKNVQEIQWVQNAEEWMLAEVGH